ncbi:unnamed protein product [Adineta steineri]|uniref:Transferrin receptor-like dimerisation domain-containing protein n=1 Tax=Adineta steineri TaxID=433720 RepID=A0A819PR57_9BILA|nr:unnamed protein product [Adineta steineri]CAF1420571.1 unnamed protein product [Adineta steineri]CAF3922531.1 unnamed protein product [Adineta steineri]CAF4018297.1 unnamed protein product [Adineta steineri]
MLLLSETSVLQLNVTRYTSALRQAMNNLKINDSSMLDPLRSAIDDFDKTAQDFVRRSKSTDTEKHIVYAPSKTNQYGVVGFPTVLDAISGGNKTEINNEIAIVTFFVRGALSTLKIFDNFFS